MIKHKTDLKKFLAEDLARYGKNKPIFKDWLLHNEKWYIHQYLISLRKVEYWIEQYKRNKSIKKIVYSVPYLYWWYRYKHLGFKTRITIAPYTCDKGLYIPHVGDMIYVKSNAKIGKNCTLRPGVVFGNKGQEYCSDTNINVGNNVSFGLGVRCFNEVCIGDNAVIGANSIITKDIPSNAVAAGNPAKVIKYK